MAVEAALFSFSKVVIYKVNIDSWIGVPLVAFHNIILFTNHHQYIFLDISISCSLSTSQLYCWLFYCWLFFYWKQALGITLTTGIKMVCSILYIVILCVSINCFWSLNSPKHFENIWNIWKPKYCYISKNLTSLHTWLQFSFPFMLLIFNHF